MNYFEKSIDRFLDSCFFCIKDKYINLLNCSPKTNDISKMLSQDGEYQISSHLFIVRIENAIKPFFLDIINFHYYYLLFNCKNKTVFCVTKELGEYIQSLKKQKVNNISPEYAKLFGDNLLKYGIVEKIPLDEEEYNSVSTQHLKEVYDRNNIKILKTLSITEIHVIYEAIYRQSKCVVRQFTKRNNYCNFDNEIDIIKSLGDTHYIPRLLFYDKTHKFYIIDYVEGISWASYIKKERTIKEKMDGIIKIIDIMSFLHSRNIVHGDIHCCQFIVEPDENIQIIDFDFITRISKKNSSFIRGGALEYLEPEDIVESPFNIIGNQKYYTLEAEVYRLGVLIYYTFYNIPPYYEATWKDMYRAIQDAELELPEKDKYGNKIPVLIINILKKCLAKDPTQRFKSAVEIREMFVHKKLFALDKKKYQNTKTY